MRRILVISFYLLAFLAASAQVNQRYWSQGPLTWDDFTVMPVPSSGERSQMFYIMTFKPVRDTIDGIRCCYYRAESYMMNSDSWVVADHRDDNTLRYNQVIFDILEVETRRLQQSINADPNPFAYDGLFSARGDRLSSRIDNFRSLSHDGTDTAVLASFERQLAAELAQYPAVYHPRYTARPFGYGMYLGVGVTGSTGTLGKAFSPGVGLNLGFNFSCNCHLFIFDGTLGYCEPNRSLLLTESDGTAHHFSAGKGCGLATIHFGYGYHVVDRLRWQLAPFAALGIREFSHNTRDRATNFAYARPEPVVGIQFYRHFWQQRSFPMYNGLFGGDRVSELGRLSLHSRLLVSYSSFPDIEGCPSGISLQAQVGISFSGRLFNVD